METKLDGFRQLWVNLTSWQKTALTFFAAFAVVAVITATMIAGRPDFTVLFANLKPEDAAGIVQKLRDAKVPYKVTANGTAVEVPSNQVYEVRLQMAGQGLPLGGSIGFEIFDKTNLGVTDFAQKMNYIRALQGELQRTLTSMEPVADARVLIVIPQDSLYSEEKKEASASVQLTLRSPGNLSDEQIASIVNLVSASVEGLKPDRVTVSDTKGNLLADGSGSDKSRFKLTATQLEATRQVERAIRQDVETMLDRVVGNDKAVVRVNARLAFDTKQTTRELVQPVAGGGGERGAVISEQVVDENYGPGARNAAVPGTASNLTPNAPVPPVANAPAGNGYRRYQSTSSYEVSRSTEKTEQAPGKIEQVNVAVLVDKDVPAASLLSIRQAVSAAAGIDPARGDRIIVESVPFSKPEAPVKPGLLGGAANYMKIGRNALAIILLIAFALFIKGALSKQQISISGTGGASPANFDPLNVPQSVAGQAAPPAAQQAEPPKLKRLDLEREIPLSNAQEIAKQSPEEIANIVRTWMNEERKAA